MNYTYINAPPTPPGGALFKGQLYLAAVSGASASPLPRPCFGDLVVVSGPGSASGSQLLEARMGLLHLAPPACRPLLAETQTALLGAHAHGPHPRRGL